RTSRESCHPRHRRQSWIGETLSSSDHEWSSTSKRLLDILKLRLNHLPKVLRLESPYLDIPQIPTSCSKKCGSNKEGLKDHKDIISRQKSSAAKYSCFYR